MKIFNLPDLGEGLTGAEIREWYVKEGDAVTIDQPLVAVETAKAIVDLPAPIAGNIKKTYGQVGYTIKVGEPIVEFMGEAEVVEVVIEEPVLVGKVATGNKILEEAAAGIMPTKTAQPIVKAQPVARALAKKHGLALENITPTGPNNMITVADVEKATKATTSELIHMNQIERAMLQTMVKSHSQVVPSTLFAEAKIAETSDITLRLIHAICTGIKAEPMLNATLLAEQYAYKLNEKINLGIAVDTVDGLFVPVINDVANKSDAELRNIINSFKEKAQTKTFTPEDLQGATIILSNFGAIAGRFATPVIIPPMVAIVAIGQVSNNLLPISVTIDHRLITGGQVARFVKAICDQKSFTNFASGKADYV